MTDAFEPLRQGVKDWYRAEAERVAESYAADPDPEKIDFSELVRRSQALFACELVALLEEPGQPDFSGADQAQLLRIAEAMRAQGKQLPDGLRQALEGN